VDLASWGQNNVKFKANWDVPGILTGKIWKVYVEVEKSGGKVKDEKKPEMDKKSKDRVMWRGILLIAGVHQGIEGKEKREKMVQF